MSNYLAIATLTATLQRTLQASIQADVDGARVTTLRPDRLNSSTPEAGVNIFLYDVLFNPAWLSADLRRRHSEEKYIKPPQTGLDLYYLLTCYGNDVELESHRLMGSIVRTFSSKAIITQDMVRETIADSTFTFLADSNLADQLESMYIIPTELNVEELSKIWSVFFQTPYSLSIAYKASVVLIDGGEIPAKPLPIRRPQPHVTPNQPAITQVRSLEPLSAIWQPSVTANIPLILATSTIVIKGNRLNADVTEIRLGNAVLTPQKVTDSQITVDLSLVEIESLRAGVQSLQVIHPQRKSSSNVVPISIRPTIQEITVTNVKGRSGNPRSADLNVVTNLTIEAKQEVALVLTEISLEQGISYTFDYSKHQRSDSNSITFAIKDCLPGTYLARLVIDGAESLLTVDRDPSSPTFEQYISPIVVIS
ncbi:MAG TPA: DUF4255 domain-containing protein [Nostocaceae cyanobacterium]|nr:DUF4255 domain-containing protein [Nostocaceae cyanobacterium]